MGKEIINVTLTFDNESESTWEQAHQWDIVSMEFEDQEERDQFLEEAILKAINEKYNQIINEDN